MVNRCLSALLTWLLQSSAAFGRGCRVRFLSPGLSFLSLPHGLCGNLQLPEPSRSKVYSQVAGGCPAPGNKSELILSCSTQVLLSTAYLQATAHLGRSGRGGGAGLTPSPLPGSALPPPPELAAAPTGLASWPEQQKERLRVTQPYFCPYHWLTLQFETSHLPSLCSICHLWEAGY